MTTKMNLIKMINRKSTLIAATVFAVATMMTSCSAEDETLELEESVNLTTTLDDIDVSKESETNRRPLAQNDFGINVALGETIVVDVLANDFDPDGDELTIIRSFGASAHDVRVVDDKVVITRLSASLSGIFYYTVSDGKGGTDQAFVRIPGIINSNG